LTIGVVQRMVAQMSRKKLSTTVYITPEQNERLKALHERTKVPVAEYIRQGIDLVLEKYADKLPGQASLGIE
jgi:predicted DNA-binding protein